MIARPTDRGYDVSEHESSTVSVQAGGENVCRGGKLKLAWVLYILLELIPAPLKAQLIVNNEGEILADQIAFRDNLLGLRPISSGFFETAQLSPDDAGIPAAAFVASASATQAMKDAIIGIGKNPGVATVEDWYSASKTVGLLDFSAEHRPVLVPATLWPGRKVQVDSVLLASLPDTELFKAEPAIYTRSVKGHSIDFLRVNPIPLRILVDSYQDVDEAEMAPPSEASAPSRCERLVLSPPVSSPPWSGRLTSRCPGKV